MFRPFPLLRPLTRLPASLHTPLSSHIPSHHHHHPFSTTPARLISPGDPLPSTDALMEHTPDHRVNLADEAAKVDRMLLIGVPAAFSPGCSGVHVPGYIKHPGVNEFDVVGIVGVNDVFVMKAWEESLEPAEDETGDWNDAAKWDEAGHRRQKFRFFADPTAKFTRMLDMLFDGSALFGGPRSKRYAIVVEQGRVKSVAVEPDNTGTDVSLAEKVLGAPAV